MLKRTLTGAVILLITALFVFLRQYHVLFFDLYVVVMSYGTLVEVSHALKIAEKPHSRFILFLIPILLCVNFNLAPSHFHAMLYTILGAFALIIYLMIEEFVLYKKNRIENDKYIASQAKTLFDRTKNTLNIFLYPIVMLSFLFAINHSGYNIGYIGIILSFAVAMLTDTFAYLFGSAMGKKKLIPEVSPNKTVVGMIGGFVGGIVGSLGIFFLFYYCNFFELQNMVSLWRGITIFAVIAIFGSFLNQIGDLVESAYKRKIGIKDFSEVFPGHGGFMDRVDGLMFASTFIYLIFTLFLV